MKNKYFKILILLAFFMLSFEIFAESQEEIMRVTRQELKDLKINEKSIEKTFEGIKMQEVDFSKSKKPFEEAVQLDGKNYLAMLYIGTYERMINKDSKKARFFPAGSNDDISFRFQTTMSVLILTAVL